MFYSETILSRRGPLGRVWLAAHMERKLSKSQTLQTDIEKSVDAIMGQEIEVMALRLSGQLLLGVVRIYSRKAKYLLDDCNEALLKIKMAFRPGVVDLTEEQLTVNKNAITLPTNGIVLDLLMPDADWDMDMDFDDRPLQRQGHHQAHVDDITLRTADDFQLGDIQDAFDIGPSDGIGSQDFNDFDLGIDWDGPRNEPNDRSDMMSVDGSIGVGREAHIGRDSLEPGHILGNGYGAEFDAFSQGEKSRAASEAPFGMDMNLELGLNLTEHGVSFDSPPAEESVPALAAIPTLSRTSSPLSDVPPTPPFLEDPEADGRPGELVPEMVEKAKKRPKDKKQIIDDVTELQNGPQSNRGRAAANANPLNTDTTTITSKQHYLPRSSIVMRLLEIRDDPINYFLPTQQLKGNNTVFSVAPPGLTPELAQLFARSMPTSPLKRKGPPVDESPSKRSRREEEVELPRRAESQAPSDLHYPEGDAPGFDGGISFGDQSAHIDDFQLDTAEVDQALGEGRDKSVVTDRSRQSSLAPGADYEEYVIDGSCPVAIFDVSQPSQTQPSQGGDKDLDEGDLLENDKGYSKNTIKALGLMRNELQPDGDEMPQAKTMSFKKMTTNASRRAASSFFFELLVLGTRDCIQVSQKTPFADIRVQAKGRLWEHQNLQGNLDRLSEPPMA